MRKQAYTILAAAVAAVAMQAQAATYNWVSGGTWDTATWTTVDGSASYPNGIGDIANLTADIAASQTLALPAGVLTLGGVNLADSNGSNAYTLSGGSLVLQAASGAAYVSTGSGTVTNAINSPATLNSDLQINLGTSSFQTGSAWNVNGKQVVITGGRTQAGAWIIGSGVDLTGSGTIINNSLGGINVTGTKSFTGTFVLNSGIGGSSNSLSLTSTSGSVKDAAEIIVNGYVEQGFGLRYLGGGYHQGANSNFATNPGQRTTSNTVTLNGGVFNMNGVNATSGTANDWQQGLEYLSDSTAVLRVNKGYTLLATGAGANNKGTRWNIADVQRTQGATAYIRSSTLGVNARIIAADGASLAVGAGGAAGTTTMSVVPWLVAANTNGSAQNGGIATYDSSILGDHAVGFRALTSAEFSSNIAAGADHNVKSSNFGAMGTGVTTINSLQHDGGSVSGIAAGKTLSVASGTVFFNLTGGGIGAPNVGTLDFGSAEGVVWSNGDSTTTTPGPKTNYIGAVVTGTGGLTKAGTGILVLRGTNDYSGKTTVAAGTLQVGDGTNISLLGDGDVEVGIGATLKLMNGDAIDDSATVILNQYGLATNFGKMDIGAGIVEDIGSLSLGGVIQAGGYYGSTAAASAFSGTYTVIANDNYFSGTGLIQVVPEPMSLGAGAVLASLAMLRRRRAN